MGLLREWAERADAMGIRGSLIHQVLKDENFETHAMEAFARASEPRKLDSILATALKEAGTSDFEDFVGKDTGVDRALLDDWRIADSSWYKFVDIVPLTDMKTVTRLRRSDTDSFLEVLEGGEHVQGQFSSYKVEYTPGKYELGLNFTWEMMINDDVAAFRNIGKQLAISGRNTLNNFVIGFLKDNPTIYDGDTLFHGNHNNLAGSALDESTLSAAIIAMRNQLSEAGNPLNITPGYLVVPPELEFTAKKIVHSVLVPGSDYNDINPLQGIVEVITEPLLTDPDNWYVVAKPSSIATIELGFLQGKQTPDIFMREDFEREVIWYKARLVFGGAVMDYRGFYGAIVSE